MDYEICNGPKYWVPKQSTGEVPVLPANARRPMDYEPVSGPAYPIIKRKRVPRGVERLRDRRAKESQKAEGKRQNEELWAKAEVERPEELYAEALEARRGGLKPRVVGKPFGPKAK